MDEAVVVESQPTDVSVGPLVGITSDERAEFRRTGNLPEKKDPPNTEEPAPSDPPKEDEADAGDPPPPKTSQERSERDKAKSAKRFNDLLEENKRLKTELEARKPTEPKPEPKPEYTRPKPKLDDKDANGNPKYPEYEDYVEDLSDWKTEQRLAARDREQAAQAQAKEFNARMAEARNRYENFDEVKDAFVSAISDAGFHTVVHSMLNESDVLPDLVFTIGSSQEDMARFVQMAKTDPGKALRYIALTESLIKEELENTPEEVPAKPKTQAPKPPSEAGGRAAAPPDALEAAAKANDFRAFKVEATRRQLAKLKS